MRKCCIQDKTRYLSRRDSFSEDNDAMSLCYEFGNENKEFNTLEQTIERRRKKRFLFSLLSPAFDLNMFRISSTSVSLTKRY